jgi:Cu+-exporting ATPase
VIALSGFVWWIFNDSLSSAIMVLTSVLIVACPCALALTLPFTFGNVMRMLGLNGMYIKNSSVIEKMVGVDTIVFDKTGTLTKPVESNIKFVGKKLDEKELRFAISLARQSTHPLSSALARRFDDISVVETDAYVEVAGRGIYATINNIPVKLGSCEYVTGTAECNSKNSSSVYLSINNQQKGYFEISNVYREGFESLFHRLYKKYELFMLSGDNDNERAYLSRFFDKDKIHFEQKPQDKMDFILKLQSEGSRVLMTGDGLNDAGAFIKSDVAMSVADDIYHFSPAGDIIIDSARFDKVPAFLDYCKKSLIIVYISFGISFLYNIIGLSFALSGNLSPVIAAILMPVSSISVVAFATFSTRLLAKKVLSY